MLAELASTDNVRAVLLRINSPGGSTAGSEALYESIRAIAGKKPVVAVLGEVAASGGYIAAIAADHIVGRGNTLTGSIGVIMEYPDLTGVMEYLNIGLETVRSSELKAEPSPFRPTNPVARALDEALVADSYAWFRDLVGERRGLAGAGLDDVANGAVFTGRIALGNGLIDEIGGEPAALDWLESRESGLADLTVRDWTVERDEPGWTRFLGRNRVKQRDSRGNIPRTGPEALFPHALNGARMPPGRGYRRRVLRRECRKKPSGVAMIKSELVQKIAEENPHLFQRDVERIVATVFDEIIEAMASGHRVELRGFGAFSVKQRDARLGRNPRTGETVEVEEKHVPFFKTGKLLRDRLNQD